MEKAKTNWKNRLGLKMEERKWRLLTAVLINLIAFLFCVVVILPLFETNDDDAMRHLIDGLKMFRDPHIVFQNILLGRLYILLYDITGRFPWYTLVQYGVLFVSFTCVTSLLIKKAKDGAGLACGFLMLSFFAIEGYSSIQFTKTAGIGSAAGLLLIYDSIEGDKTDRWELALGYVVAVAGSMFRFRQFLPCFLLLGGIGLYQLLKTWREEKEKLKKRLIRMAAALAGVVVVAYAFYGYDRSCYKSEEWQYFFAINNAREMLLDFYAPDYGLHLQQYQDLGIDESAFALLAGWNYSDPEVFSAKVLEEIVSWKPPIDVINKAKLKEFLTRFPWEFFGRRTFYFYLAAVIIWLLFKKKDKLEWLIVFCEIALFGAMYYYLFATGRYMKNRVDVCLWFAIGMVMLYLALERKIVGETKPAKAGMRMAETGETPAKAGMLMAETAEKSARTRRLATPAILLLTVIALTAATLSGADGTKPLWRWSHDAKYEQSAWHEYTNRVKILAADADHLYVSKIALITGIYGGDPLIGPEVGIMKNLVYLGGWTNYGSVYLKTLEAYGVTNPYKDLIDNDKVYLVDNDINLTLTYLRNHYNPDAQAEEVMDVGPNTVWRIYTEAQEDAT